MSALLLFTTGHNFHLLSVLSFKTNHTLLFQLSISLFLFFLSVRNGSTFPRSDAGRNSRGIMW